MKDFKLVEIFVLLFTWVGIFMIFAVDTQEDLFPCGSQISKVSVYLLLFLPFFYMCIYIQDDKLYGFE